MKYVVEHLEDEMGDWCRLEYAHMLKHIGTDDLLVSNISTDDAQMLPYGVKTDSRSFKELNIPSDRVCLLDPKGEKELTSDDIDKFDYMLFGGILGDDPPRDRTGVLRPLGCVRRQLGNRQMSTDTAVLCCHKIIHGGLKLSDIEFRDDIDVQTHEKEFVHLPYRYIVENGDVVMNPDLVEYLKNDEIALDDEDFAMNFDDAGEPLDVEAEYAAMKLVAPMAAASLDEAV